MNKRLLSNHDADVVASSVNALVKAGVAATAMIAIGPIATAGVLVSYELSNVILDSQKKRLIDFAAKFSRKTAFLSLEEQNRMREQLTTEAGDRIFESAWQQAAREVDPEKLDMLASLLKNSLSSKQLQEHQTRWLLKVLDELDAAQFIILQSFTQEAKRDETFRSRHIEVFNSEKAPRPPHAPDFRSSVGILWAGRSMTNEEKETHDGERALWLLQYKAYENDLPTLQEEYELARERHALFRSRIHMLVERGLLGIIKKGKVNQFNEVAPMVEEDLTPLGMALLKIVDVVKSSEWGQGEQLSSVQAVQQSITEINQSIESNKEKERNALYGMSTGI